MSLDKRATQVFFLGMMSFAFSLGPPRLHAQQTNTGTDQSASSAVKAETQAEDAELKPPNPPSVICKNDTLSISASNSTLSAVLEAVRACTGSEMEIPDSAADERLFAELGPGSVKRVLTSLLGDTDFNFLIQTSDSDSAKVRAVVLMGRNNSGPANFGTTAAENVSAARRAWQQARRNALQSTTGQIQDSDASATDSAPSFSTETTPIIPAATPAASPTPSGASDTSSATAEISAPKAEAVAAASDTGAATQQNATQQLIQDMRRMFEERRQMQDRQPSPK